VTPKLSVAFRRASAASFFLLAFGLHAATPLPQPTEEELKMTSQPQVPGAAAVMLYHEETTEDISENWTFCSSIKILSEAGRDKYSTVVVQYPFSRWRGLFGGDAQGLKVDAIVARTIQPDGTIVPFTGKPFVRTVVKSSGFTIRETVFTLPDVRVGSIIQYRYVIHFANSFDSGYVFIPTWYVQTELFARRQHFLWRTGLRNVFDTSTLPGGTASVKTHHSAMSNQNDFTVDIENVMPIPDEPFMPPVNSIAQRVIFYSFSDLSIHSGLTFWAETGKYWSQDIDSFLESPSALADPVASMTAGASSPEERLRKIYAAVMQMKNTRFSRAHTAEEDKAASVSKTVNAGDVLKHQSGTPDELTLLFVALARATGFKAYIFVVTDRDENIFFPSWLSYRQLDDDLAIVEVDGKDRFFDPGEPFCPYGQLEWTHAGASGLRQTSSGTAFATAPVGNFKDSLNTRTADLVMATNGRETGSVTLSFSGNQALVWRQATLSDDDASLHRSLETYLRDRLPTGTDVSFRSIENLAVYEKPLITTFSIDGPFAVTTSKRAILPSQLFAVQAKPLFPEEKRETPVLFEYPERITDVVTVNLPAAWQIESMPKTETFTLPNVGAYQSTSKNSGNSLLIHRDYLLATIAVPITNYAGLREFYSRLAIKDQEPVVIRTATAPTP
jgi:hypothetical protein